MRTNCFVHFAIAALVACGHDLVAQGTGGTDPLLVGIREPAEFLTERYGIQPGAFAGTNSFLASPSLLGVDGATMYGGTLVWTNKSFGIHALQFKAGYKRIDKPTDDANRGLLDAKIKVLQSTEFGEASAHAGFQKTFDVGTREDYDLAWSHPIGPASRKLSVGATGTLTSLQPENGTKLTAGKLGVGTVWHASSTGELDLDYTLKNAVDHEDAYAFTAAQTITNLPYQPTVIVVVGKHRLIAASVLFPLPF